MDTIVLIPAYQPDQALIDTAAGLRERGFHVLIVDDGSGESYTGIFRKASAFGTILRKKVNHGKGAALKSGFHYIQNRRPDCKFVITADADGQHKPEDVARVSDFLHEYGGLVIGSRQFLGDVPARSLFGNTITRSVFAAVSGVRVGDTQTGLRGFGVRLIPWLLTVPGERYEYEMNMLLDAARRKIPIAEVEIQTVYEAGNSSSHFDPVKDSVKIYRCIFRYALAGLSAPEDDPDDPDDPAGSDNPDPADRAPAGTGAGGAGGVGSVGSEDPDTAAPADFPRKERVTL